MEYSAWLQANGTDWSSFKLFWLPESGRERRREVLGMMNSCSMIITSPQSLGNPYVFPSIVASLIPSPSMISCWLLGRLRYLFPDFYDTPSSLSLSALSRPRSQSALSASVSSTRCPSSEQTRQHLIGASNKYDPSAAPVRSICAIRECRLCTAASLLDASRACAAFWLKRGRA